MHLVTAYTLLQNFKQDFPRRETYHWFILIVIGFMACPGVSTLTDVIRYYDFNGNAYDCLVKHMKNQSETFIRHLNQRWIAFVFQLFQDSLHRLRGCLVFVTDSTKVVKVAKRMPGVKSLHSGSDNSGKPKHFMGHHHQVICVLGKHMKSFFCLPLLVKLTEGIRNGANLKDKFHEKTAMFLDEAIFQNPFLDPKSFQGAILLGDSYYHAAEAYSTVSERNMALVTRARKNSVGYEVPRPPETPRRGRKRKYGEAIKLNTLFQNRSHMTALTVENADGTLREGAYWERRLLSKNAKKLLKFVGYECSRGQIILVSSRLDLTAKEIVELYISRFQIETEIKTTKNEAPTFTYRYWSKFHAVIKRCSILGSCLWKYKGKAKENIQKTIEAIELQMLYSIIAIGMLRYLSIKKGKEIMTSTPYYRTKAENAVPSEKMVKSVVSVEQFNFLRFLKTEENWGKFLKSKIFKGEKAEFLENQTNTG